MQKQDLQKLPSFQLGHFSYHVVLLFVIGVLSGCGKKVSIEQKVQKAQSQKMGAALSSSALLQARTIDVPTPIGFTLISYDQHDQLEHFVYAGSLQLDEVRLFFAQEMERLGWSVVPFVAKEEIVLFCSKPSKHCIVSVRSAHNGAYATQLVLIVQPSVKKKKIVE